MKFKLEYAMFFRRDANGHFHQLPTNALDEEILSVDGATLKLDNKKCMERSVCLSGKKRI